MTQTPNHDDFCERIEVDIGVGVQTSPCYCDYRKLEREIIELKRQLAEAQRDAERYRWLRDADKCDESIPHTEILRYSMESLDAAIDQAIQEQKK